MDILNHHHYHHRHRHRQLRSNDILCSADSSFCDKDQQQPSTEHDQPAAQLSHQTASQQRHALARLVQQCASVHFSQNFANIAAAAVITAEPCSQVYIVGSLILTLTASVHPQHTLTSHRQRTVQKQLHLTESHAAVIAEAGLTVMDDAGSSSSSSSSRCSSSSILRCFHCGSKIPISQVTSVCGVSPSAVLRQHNAASPSCYFVRLHNFVQQHQEPEDACSVQRDSHRYMRALQKLYKELHSAPVELARKFGLEECELQFAATRYFMRHSGCVPARAGDVIAQVYHCHQLFQDGVLQLVSILLLL